MPRYLGNCNLDQLYFFKNIRIVIKFAIYLSEGEMFVLFESIFLSQIHSKKYFGQKDATKTIRTFGINGLIFILVLSVFVIQQ